MLSNILLINKIYHRLGATFNNISVISWSLVLLVEETGENDRPVASHWQTLSHNIVSSSPRLRVVRNIWIIRKKRQIFSNTLRKNQNIMDKKRTNNNWLILTQDIDSLDYLLVEIKIMYETLEIQTHVHIAINSIILIQADLIIYILHEYM
jgi:hypothetical protein